jgi:hypothetical protein
MRTFSRSLHNNGIIRYNILFLVYLTMLWVQRQMVISLKNLISWRRVTTRKPPPKTNDVYTAKNVLTAKWREAEVRSSSLEILCSSPERFWAPLCHSTNSPLTSKSGRSVSCLLTKATDKDGPKIGFHGRRIHMYSRRHGWESRRRDKPTSHACFKFKIIDVSVQPEATMKRNYRKISVHI